ncbi:MAG TPA: hypothetical protein DDW87_10705 [Firmicutes bacterium]|nr:hypothetical protein [Bacillota bacterium]
MTRLDGLFWAFFVLGAVLLTGLVAGILPQSEEIRLALLFWQQLLFAVGGYLGVRKEVLRRPDRNVYTCGALSGLGLFAVNTVLGFLSVQVALRFLEYDLVQNLIFRERVGVEMLLTSNKPLIVLGTTLLLTIGAPLGEELFFRGLLVDLWKESLGAKQAVFVVALVFAFLHFYVLQFIPVLLSGLILGILFVHSENVFVPILAHAVANILVLVIWLSGL